MIRSLLSVPNCTGTIEMIKIKINHIVSKQKFRSLKSKLINWFFLFENYWLKCLGVMPFVNATQHPNIKNEFCSLMYFWWISFVIYLLIFGLCLFSLFTLFHWHAIFCDVICQNSKIECGSKYSYIFTAFRVNGCDCESNTQR